MATVFITLDQFNELDPELQELISELFTPVFVDGALTGYEFTGEDADGNNVPDLYEQILGIGIGTNPSQGNIGG